MIINWKNIQLINGGARISIQVFWISVSSSFPLYCQAAPKNIPKERNVIKGELLSWKSSYVNSFQYHYFSTCLQFNHCLSNPNPFSPFLNKDEFVISIKSICVKNYVCNRDVFLCIKECLTLFLTEI